MPTTIAEFSEVIRTAAARRSPLRIRGGGTKDFYGGSLTGEILDTRGYSGIVEYEPTEIVITARAGTPLAQVEAALAERGQMLAFEPPRFAAGGTLGGVVASGLSGPRRPYAGAVRDFLLGVRMLDGKGTDLRFGGQVMKNVAGYDLSRLMVGALGTLGLITEISLKVLPRPITEVTLRQERSQPEAIALMNEWAGQPYPISGTCHVGGTLYVRLSGAEPAVAAAHKQLGGERAPDGEAFWRALRDQAMPFFADANPLWRLSIKATAAPLALGGSELIEWNGALRWLSGVSDVRAIREAAARAGGHATLFRAPDKSAGVFQPLAPEMAKMHGRLKATLDPDGVLNPGRMYADW